MPTKLLENVGCYEFDEQRNHLNSVEKDTIEIPQFLGNVVYNSPKVQMCFMLTLAFSVLEGLKTRCATRNTIPQRIAGWSKYGGMSYEPKYYLAEG